MNGLCTHCIELVARENSERDDSKFTEVLAIDIRISKPDALFSYEIGESEKLEEEQTDSEPVERVRRSKRKKAKIIEAPSIVLPPEGDDVSLGSMIEFRIHDAVSAFFIEQGFFFVEPSDQYPRLMASLKLATTERVKFVLRSPYTKQRTLGQAAFKEHLAGGRFKVPSDIPFGTYSQLRCSPLLYHQ